MIERTKWNIMHACQKIINNNNCRLGNPHRFLTNSWKCLFLAKYISKTRQCYLKFLSIYRKLQLLRGALILQQITHLHIFCQRVNRIARIALWQLERTSKNHTVPFCRPGLHYQLSRQSENIINDPYKNDVSQDVSNITTTGIEI